VTVGYHCADGSTGEETTSSIRSIEPVVSTKAPKPVPVRPLPAAPPVVDPDPDPDPPCGPAYGPDAPPCPAPVAPALAPARRPRHAGHTPDPSVPSPAPTPQPDSSGPSTKTPAPSRVHHRADSPPAYDGIHRHGEDHAFARVIIEADLTPADKVIFNLLALWPESGKPAWGYAAGYRHVFSHAFAAGVEAIGDFGDANEHELVLGGYVSPTHHLTFKLGAGMGLTATSPDFSLRTGVVWRF
jgi:hypothetical protein